MKQLINIMLLLATTFIYSQNSFDGKIIDKATKIEMPFVNVYIPNIEKGTMSDEDGTFTVTDLPSGKFKIIFSMIGYETLSMEITFPNETSFNIEMTASAIEMEDVIISMPFHKLQSENVMKVERETIKNLKANGAVTLSSGISDIVGVSSVTTGLGIGKPVIRGLSSNRVLVYTQGVRLENQQYGDEHGLGLNDAGIESVEVIKGPASLLYGSDALGGVLYLNPEKFADINKSSGDFSGNYFSNTNGYNTNAGYKTSGDHFKFLFRGSLTEHSDYNADAYRVTNTRFREQDFKAGLGYQKSNFKTEFRYNINNSKIGIPEEIGEQSKSKAPLLPYQNITNHIFSSKSSLFFNDSKLDINLGYIYNDRKEFEDHHNHEGEEDDDEEHDEDHEGEHGENYDIFEPALHMKLKTFNYDIKYSLPDIGAFETIIGAQGMNQTNSNYGEEELIPNATTNDVGFLAVTHAHFNEFGIQIGARYDSRSVELQSGFNKKFNSFNGSAGIKFNINNQITTRLNLATGFRAPNLSELFSDGTHEGTNRYEIGNSDLNNEQNFQTDLAVEFKNEHVEFFVNGFYNMINDYIFLSPNGDVIDEDPVFVYLQNNARLYGGELGFHLHPHPLDWLHLESSFETVTGQLEDDRYLPLIPANNLTNTIRVEFEKPWINQGYAFIKLQSTFNQNNISAFETPTESYNLLSAGIGGTLKLFNNDLLINISGTNLTNVRFISHLSRLKPDGIFNMGRNFNLGFTYHL